jgi:hypothetical protein
MVHNIEASNKISWIPAAIVVLSAIAIAGMGLSWYDESRLQAAQQVSRELKTAEQTTTDRVARLEQRLTKADAANEQLQSDVQVVTMKLRLTQVDLEKARDQATQVAAQTQADDAQKLAQLDTEVKAQLATKASSDDVNNGLSTVNGKLNGVKADLKNTKNDLTMARSELGTIIARNHDEIDVLRRMGGRDIMEFTLRSSNKPQRVGNIMVELRSTNPKKNQFTVLLIFDDIRTEAKDRVTNQPIVFYPQENHQADELVVNTVGKNTINGYISLPRYPANTTTAAASLQRSGSPR